MSKVRLTGSTSGYTEIQASAVAGDNTLSLPTTTDGTLLAADSSGNVNLDSGTLYVDAANNRVGIGNTVPGSFDAEANQLVIGNGAGDQGLTIYTGDAVGSYGSIFFADGTSGGATKKGQIRYEQNNEVMSFWTNEAERCRIDLNGRLLVGTSSSSANTRVVIAGRSDGNAAGTLVLESTSSSPASGDTLGNLRYGTSGNTASLAGAAIGAERDGGTWTNNSSMPTRLVFSTTVDGASSPTERMRIDSGGKTNFYRNTATTTSQIISGQSDVGGAASTVFYVRANGGIGNYQSNNVDLSDAREKRNVQDAPATWDCLKNWEIVEFNYVADSVDESPRFGVIAQQVQQHCPEVVIPYQEAEEAIFDVDGAVVVPAKEERLGVREQQMMWMAIKALQEAMERIETLEAANTDLAARITALEAN